jgi:prepilin-type processing-associated H-X9-DG protein
MLCPKCGTQNPDDAQSCRSCACALAGTATTAAGQPAKTSGLAVAALVLAILTPFTCLLTFVPALVCGIMALTSINKSAGRLKGKGLAVAGITVSAVALPVVLALLMAILMPALSKTRVLAIRAVCSANMHGIANAISMYAEDNGAFPTTSKWCDLLIKNQYVNEEQFRCRAAPEGRCSYAINSNLEQLGAAAPADMVLLFETRPGWNQSGGPEILTTENHQGDGCNVAFVDGSVRFLLEFEHIRWTAQENE